MKLSIVILTCNQRGFTLACLESIKPLIDSPECEVILVDNGSTDGTSEAIRARFPRVKVGELQVNIGVAAGRNTGLKMAQGSYLMILDNDTEATPDAIRSLVSYLDENPDVGLVAPRLVDAHGNVQTSARPFPGIFNKLKNLIVGKSRSGTDKTGADDMTPREPFYVIGAAQMFRSAIYEKSPGLDEKIFYGPEDADFCIEVRRQGFKVVYLPTATITHHWHRDGRKSIFSKTTRRHIAGLFHFYCKHRRC